MKGLYLVNQNCLMEDTKSPFEIEPPSSKKLVRSSLVALVFALLFYLLSRHLLLLLFLPSNRSGWIGWFQCGIAILFQRRKRQQTYL